MIEAKIDPDKKIMFFIAFLLIVVGIGYTFSYFRSSDSSEEQTVKTGKLSINYAEDESGIINAINIVPISDTDIKVKATKLDFKVTNDGTLDTKYDIKLTNLTIDSELANAEFKWALYSGEDLIIEKDFSTASTGNDYMLIENENLNSTNSRDYTLYIWISETNVPQNEMIDKNFKAKIEVNAHNV